MTNPVNGHARHSRLLPWAGFMLVLVLVFLQKTAGSWTEAGLLPGGHIDGPFHFYCTYIRLNPEALPGDLAVQSNRELGAYDYFYSALATLAQFTGLDLIDVNMAVNWAGNIAYLSGVFLLLLRLGASCPWAMIGTFWAAQRYALVLMNGGILHSLAIPREVTLAPMPWLILLFILAPRSGWFYGLFFSGLGLLYTWTYPLWALIFGLMFGLASLTEILRARRWNHLIGLLVGSAVCLGLVALTALNTYSSVTGQESAILDYNTGHRWVYWQKGFRRLLMFAVPALVVAMWWSRRPEGMPPALRRLALLLICSTGVCLMYEPLERLAHHVSLLYLGRLSLAAQLLAILILVLWFQHHWIKCRWWVKILTAAAALYALSYPLNKELPTWFGPPAVQQDPEFVRFCHSLEADPATRSSLFIVEPLRGTNYFRVYARRSLWIHPKDEGILSRTRDLYREGQTRNQTLALFFNPQASDAQRQMALQKMLQAGVSFVAARESSLPRPAPAPLASHGSWRLWRLQDWLTTPAHSPAP